MRTKIVLAIALSALVGCSTTATALQPIPGSITYGGQPRTKLTKSPIGSIVPHEFVNNFGERVHETYVLQPDRTLKLTGRYVETDSLFGDN